MANNKQGLLDTINMKIFATPAIMLVLFIIWGVTVPKNFASVNDFLLQHAIKYFTWFMAPCVVAMFGFCIWAAYSKYGNIRLGGADAKPTMSMAKWFAITLTAGTGAGLCFYGVYQPIQILNNMPPFMHCVTATESVLAAFDLTYLQWTINTYSIYTVCGVVIGFLYYNTKRKYRISEMFYTLVGDKVDGTFGYVIDSLGVYLIIIGVAITLGFSTLQTSMGMKVLFGFESNPTTWLIALASLTLIFTWAAVSGIEKAVTLMSSVNMYLYFWIVIWALVFVDPFNIMNLVFTSVGSFFSHYLFLSMHCDPITQSNWVGNNPIFIYCWWALFAPVMGLFLIKLAYGRTIREFVTVNLVAPCIFSYFWFTWLGGGAIFIDMFRHGTIYKTIASDGASTALYTLCNYLPLPTLMKYVSFLIVILSLVTLGEAMSVAMASYTAKNYEDTNGLTKPPVVLTIFWSIIMAATTYIMLLAGGMNALMANGVVWGFPILIAECFMMYGYIKCMGNLKKYDKTGDYVYLNDITHVSKDNLVKEINK